MRRWEDCFSVGSLHGLDLHLALGNRENETAYEVMSLRIMLWYLCSNANLTPSVCCEAVRP
jgi:hypothetical protein